MPLPPTSDMIRKMVALVHRAAIVKAMALDRLPEIKGVLAKDYRGKIYEAAKLYWKEGSKGNFLTRTNAAIKFGLTDAWEAGAAEVGVQASEFSQEDKDQIAGIITEEKSHVSDLLTFLDGLANNPAAKLADADYRLDLWANRFDDIVNAARIYFGGRTRLQWNLGGSKEHCSTCASLNGIVAFAEEWNEAGLRPGDPGGAGQLLECGGWNCACSLTVTTKRRSARALDRLMAIATSSHGH